MSLILILTREKLSMYDSIQTKIQANSLKYKHKKDHDTLYCINILNSQSPFEIKMITRSRLLFAC